MKPDQFLGRQALRALHAELVLEPKPGLVSLRDPGSHHDMDAGTFMRSLFALRHYFAAIARAGAAGAPFPHLQALGLQAEARMLAATGGVNTHRGAVFGLGLLCASAGRLHALGRPLHAQGLQDTLQCTWGEALCERARLARERAPRSHGEQAARRHGLRGAGDEAADAFPTLFHTTLPVLQQATQQGWPPRSARVQALFATLAVLADTNLVHRGGIEGLRFARRAARDFLAAGGAARPDWLAHARAVHAAFVARRLSPGGSADLLGMACWCAAVCETVAANPAKDLPGLASPIRGIPPFALSLSKGRCAWHQGFDKLSPNGARRVGQEHHPRSTPVRPELVEGPACVAQGCRPSAVFTRPGTS